MHAVIHHIADAFRRTNRNFALVLVPILLDALALWAGWAILGRFVRQDWSVRVILEIGLPSISHVMERPLLANTLPFLAAARYSDAAVVVFALLLVASCFAQGGYIGALHAIAGGGRFRLPLFYRAGKRSVLRLLLLYATVQLLKSAVALLLAAIAGASGIFLALLVMLALRVIYLFLEFVIVVESQDWIGALGRARELLTASCGRTLATAAVWLAVSGAVSASLHRVASPAGLLAAIAIYAYAMTWIHVSLMMHFVKAQAETDSAAPRTAAAAKRDRHAPGT